MADLYKFFTINFHAWNIFVRSGKEYSLYDRIWNAYQRTASVLAYERSRTTVVMMCWVLIYFLEIHFLPIREERSVNNSSKTIMLPGRSDIATLRVLSCYSELLTILPWKRSEWRWALKFLVYSFAKLWSYMKAIAALSHFACLCLLFIVHLSYIKPPPFSLNIPFEATQMKPIKMYIPVIFTSLLLSIIFSFDNATSLFFALHNFKSLGKHHSRLIEILL